MSFIDYIKETRMEMKHVSWPTKRQASMLTLAVIIISILTAAYLGALDEVFVNLLEIFV